MLSVIFQSIKHVGVIGFGRMVLLKLTQPQARCHPLAISLIGQKSGIEIGGPTPHFSVGGFLPLYESVGSLDNVNYSNQTIWENTITAGKTFRYHPVKEPGNQFIAEAANLDQVKDHAYDFVLSSHTLEHSANPLKALAEFKRVLKPGGALIIIVPHHQGTFDFKRPVTKFAHIIDDQAKNTAESDLNHLEEILKLHDLKRDQAAGTRDEFEARCRQNMVNRCLHHHVFDSHLLAQVLDHAGFQILAAEARLPYHTFCVVVNPLDKVKVDNTAFLSHDAEHIRQSPFSTDRRQRS